MLFLQQAQSKAKAKTKKEAINFSRMVHVEGGRGNTKCDAWGGKMSVTLAAGEGLKELKAHIRKAFGKYPRHTMGSLQLLQEGQAVREAKTEDLVEGARVLCTYTYAPGNPSIGFGGGGRGFRGFGGGGRGFRSGGLFGWL
jgi:hypothetical protein